MKYLPAYALLLTACGGAPFELGGPFDSGQPDVLSTFSGPDLDAGDSALLDAATPDVRDAARDVAQPMHDAASDTFVAPVDAAPDVAPVADAAEVDACPGPRMVDPPAVCIYASSLNPLTAPAMVWLATSSGGCSPDTTPLACQTCGHYSCACLLPRINAATGNTKCTCDVGANSEPVVTCP